MFAIRLQVSSRRRSKVATACSRSISTYGTDALVDFASGRGRTRFSDTFLSLVHPRSLEKPRSVREQQGLDVLWIWTTSAGVLRFVFSNPLCTRYTARRLSLSTKYRRSTCNEHVKRASSLCTRQIAFDAMTLPGIEPGLTP